MTAVGKPAAVSFWEELAAIVIAYDGRLNSAAGIEDTFEAGASRAYGGYDVIESAVHDVFVEYPFVAIEKQVLLEALQFKAELIRNVGEKQCGIVRLAGLGADTGKLRNRHLDFVLPVRVDIGKGFDLGGFPIPDILLEPFVL
jgi:hypothetical protein